MDVSLSAKAGGQCFPGQLGTGSNRRAGRCVAQTESARHLCLFTGQVEAEPMRHVSLE